MAKNRTRRSFWNRNLQASKVRRALEMIGASESEFKTAYEATRKTREMRPITERFSTRELEHIRAFRDHGNIHTLAAVLGKSVTGAASIVSRAVAEGVL